MLMDDIPGSTAYVNKSRRVSAAEMNRRFQMLEAALQSGERKTSHKTINMYWRRLLSL